MSSRTSFRYTLAAALIAVCTVGGVVAVGSSSTAASTNRTSRSAHATLASTAVPSASTASRVASPVPMTSSQAVAPARRPVPAAPPSRGPGAPPAATPPPAGMAVGVQGNTLVDGAGHPMVVRGVNLTNTEVVCVGKGTSETAGYGVYGGPLDQPSTYQVMKTWHINVVRVPLNEDCWLGINGVSPSMGGVNYELAIEAEVNLIHQAGMYAIVDLHWSAPGATLATGQNTMADAEHSLPFWTSVATAFKNDPATIFDLYNEPHPHDSEIPQASDPYGWDCWRNGCAMSSVNGGWQSAGMQTMIDAVRATGAANSLLVNGNGWGNDDLEWLKRGLQDPRGKLIAGLHSYTNMKCQLPACWYDANGYIPISDVAAHVPMIIGETGDVGNGTITYLDKELPFADSHGLSYLAWAWRPSGTEANNWLIQNWSGAPGTGEGTYFRNHLLSVQ